MSEQPSAAPVPPRKEDVFQERELYRRRRLIDGAKMVPVLAAIMFLLPAIMAGAQSEDGASTAMRLVYFFFVWLVMIMVAATFARGLNRTEKETTDADDTVPPRGSD